MVQSNKHCVCQSQTAEKSDRPQKHASPLARALPSSQVCWPLTLTFNTAATDDNYSLEDTDKGSETRGKKRKKKLEMASSVEI